jgi:hypothetical protein
MLSSITRVLRGRGDTTPARTKALIIVPPWSENDRASGQARANDIFNLLRRLGNFINKEQIPCTVVLVGQPLSRLADDSRHYGVLIRYAETVSQAATLTARLVREAGGDGESAVACAATGPVAEAADGAGALRIGLNTLDKALDAIVGQPQAAPRPPRPDAPHREERKDRPKPAPAPESAEAEPPKPPRETQDSAVLDLIDPL